MPPRRRFENLRQPPPVILPSLLLCDFGHLADEVQAVEAAGARALHLDVMDGNFVPNMTYGMTIVKTVRGLTELPLDAHLMIARPAEFVDAFVDAGADIITIHVEAIADPRPALERIRARGAAAGLALNPSTSLEVILPALPLCDMVLVMSVEPGFGAQAFEPVALDKLRTLRREYGDRLVLEVDGGVNAETITACTAAGAQMLVVGSAIFRNKNASYAQTMAQLNQLATQ